MNTYKPEHTKAPQEIFDLLLDHFRGPITITDWRQSQLGDWVCTFYSGSASMVAHIEREEYAYGSWYVLIDFRGGRDEATG